VVLAGKIVSIFVTLAVQVAVLLLLSALIFKIDWGNLGSIVLASVGTVAAAGGFGLFVMSFVKTNRQAGPVLGAVLTLTGVAGGTITTGFQNMPAFYNTLTLVTPQGWALNAWKASLAGSLPGQVILPVAVLCLIGLVFFAIGALIFRKRYA
jgi:ABC-type multidrug transport system permease subunit